MAETRFTVAIDGPAAAGKGTLARALAERFGLAHLDTGLLYRAVGVKARAAAGDPIPPDAAIAAAEALAPEDLEAPDLRTGEAGEAASQVAAIPEVRAALLAFQRDFARREGGAVLDGRDIGTVVCPEADVKLFVTASDETRARRRHAELAHTGVTLEAVLADLRRRDARDAGRADAPMRPAPDALLLDTTELTIDRAIAEAADLIAEKREG
ncbi:MAG TPA: (d)CMP kinase [Paracoccaceae bacterium]|nr:(d)CMP kinase [Paracoccaceae bacterium]